MKPKTSSKWEYLKNTEGAYHGTASTKLTSSSKTEKKEKKCTKNQVERKWKPKDINGQKAGMAIIGLKSGREKIYQNPNNQTDEIFYREAWNISKKVCENCGKELKGFSRSYIAHLLSKKAFPRFRHNLDNYATLCLQCHDQLDARDKKKMKIWPQLKERIEKLLIEYYKK